MIEQEMKQELKSQMKPLHVKKGIKQQIFNLLSTELNPHKLENILKNFPFFKKEIMQLNKKKIIDKEILEGEISTCIEKYKHATPTRVKIDSSEQKINKRKKTA